MTGAPPGGEPRFELHLQLPCRHVVRRIGKLHAGLSVIELDEIDVVEDVVAVGAFIAVALRERALSPPGAMNQTHNGSMRLYAPEDRL